jgi:hypothetical protein
MSLKRPHSDNVFFKRKLIATPVGRAPAPTAQPLPRTDKLSTELHRPRTLADIFGNSQMKQRIKSWMQAGGTTLCCVSGPVGCGKTSLARVVMSGRDIVHLRDSPDMFTVLVDVLRTPHRKPTGVVVDEIENLPAAHRTKLLGILSSRNPSLPVICICTNPADRAVSTFVKACGTHIQMTRPSTAITEELVLKVAPRLPRTARAAIARTANGDLRQATILAHQAQVEHAAHAKTGSHAVDRRITNIFDACRMAFYARSLDEAAEAVQYDSMVCVMAQDALPRRMYTVPVGQGQEFVEHALAQMNELSARMDRMCDGDLMDAHAAHQVHHIAHHQYAEGVLGLRSRRGAPNPTFPKTLGMAARRRDNRGVIREVAPGTDPTDLRWVRELIQAKPASRKKFNSIKF